jgi:hypothetical protein
VVDLETQASSATPVLLDEDDEPVAEDYEAPFSRPE